MSRVSVLILIEGPQVSSALFWQASEAGRTGFVGLSGVPGLEGTAPGGLLGGGKSVGGKSLPGRAGGTPKDNDSTVGRRVAETSARSWSAF